MTDVNETDVYNRTERLGNGTYGVVYKAIRKRDAAVVAIKEFMSDALRENGNENDNENTDDHTARDPLSADALREMSALRMLNGHPGVVQMHEICIGGGGLAGNKPSVVLECCRHTLHDEIVMEKEKRKQKQKEMKNENEKAKEEEPEKEKDYAAGTHSSTTWNQRVCRWLYQLLSTVTYLNSVGIWHRDLKPRNLLITNDDNLKIADFGMSRMVTYDRQRPLTPTIQTLLYRAPEVLLGQECYSSSVDVFSIGCIFAEMLTLDHLFDSDCEIDQLFRIFRRMGTPTIATWPEVMKLPHFKSTFPNFVNPTPWDDAIIHHHKDAASLLNAMLMCNPSHRISASGALQHSYWSNNEFHKTSGECTKY